MKVPATEFYYFILQQQTPRDLTHAFTGRKHLADPVGGFVSEHHLRRLRRARREIRRREAA